VMLRRRSSIGDTTVKYRSLIVIGVQLAFGELGKAFDTEGLVLLGNATLLYSRQLQLKPERGLLSPN